MHRDGKLFIASFAINVCILHVSMQMCYQSQQFWDLSVLLCVN